MNNKLSLQYGIRIKKSTSSLIKCIIDNKIELLEKTKTNKNVNRELFKEEVPDQEEKEKEKEEKNKDILKRWMILKEKYEKEKYNKEEIEDFERELNSMITLELGKNLIIVKFDKIREGKKNWQIRIFTNIKITKNNFMNMDLSMMSEEPFKFMIMNISEKMFEHFSTPEYFVWIDQ
jgi:hypothetical protein